MAMASLSLNEYQQEAEREQARYAAALTAIDKSPDLTEEGRQRQRESAYEKTRAKIDDLKQQYTAERASRRQAAERRLFSLGSSPSPETTIAFRDAMDRAQHVTPESITATMRRAILSGDQMLAKAILARAIEFHSERAVAAYTDAYPDDTAAVEEAATPDDMLNLMSFLLIRSW